VFITLDLPPGLVALGTDYRAKGRYIYADLMRWSEGVIQPVGGWRTRSDDVVSGMARACLTWADNSGQSWIGIGTNTNLYAMTRSGALSDITPVGFSPGPVNATVGGGYGTGLYGTATYGTPRPDSINIIPAASWTLDTFGENLVGVMDADNKLYQWELNVANPAEEVVEAPECYAVLVTQEGIVMALGADDGSTLNPRYIKWSGLQNITDWTPTATNQSRDALLQTQGRIVTGKRVPGGALILTDEGAFLGTYVGPPFVYTFQRVGAGCGIVSRQAVAVTQNATFWMGRNGFYVFNGYVSDLPCDVKDYIFSRINRGQLSKVSVLLNSDFNEVTWSYPSSNSLEVDSYVTFNYQMGVWYFGALDRTCGTGSNGVLQYPIMIGTDGLTYDHEVGTNRDGRQPYLQSSPVEIGAGDNVIMLKRYIPDERNAGQVQVNFRYRAWPQAPESQVTIDATTPADFRLTARQIAVEYVGDPDIDFRIGSFRFDAQQGGKR